MEKSLLGVIVGVIILLGTVSAITLFMAGRTPPGAPVVPANQATLASDQVAVARVPFDGAVVAATGDDRRVRVRTRIAAGYRLVDVGLARVALRARVEEVVAWDRLRRSGEPVDVAVPLGDTAGAVPIGRPGDGPLDVRLMPHRATDDGWVFTMGPVEVRLAGDRLRIDDGPVPIDLPVLGPGRWVAYLDAAGDLQRIERSTVAADRPSAVP